VQFSSSQFLSSNEQPGSPLGSLPAKPNNVRMAAKPMMKPDEFLNLHSAENFYGDQRNPWRPALASAEPSDKGVKKVQRPFAPSDFVDLNSTNSIWTVPSPTPLKMPAKTFPFESPSIPYQQPPESAQTLLPVKPEASTDSAVFKFLSSNPSLNIEEELTGQSLYKTELCRSFEETGNCRYGAKCQFAHGKAELRQLLRHPKYKTEVCKTFHTIGTCPYGNRCRFIHTSPENNKKKIPPFASQEFCSLQPQAQNFKQQEQEKKVHRSIAR